jgi:hypothetical protein
VAGLDIRNANNGAPPQSGYTQRRILYLELRPRPMIREHARPQPPAGSRRCGGGAEEPAPVPGRVDGRGHRPPNPAAQESSWTPRTTPSLTQLLTGPRGRTVANISPPGPSDRAAGQASSRSRGLEVRVRRLGRQPPAVYRFVFVFVVCGISPRVRFPF